MSERIDPNKAVEFILKHGPEYAKAKAERIYVEEFRKTIKARLMKASSSDAIGAQEREAYAHDEYAAHLESIRAAVEIEETLRWKLVAAQARIEVFRSLEASARAEGRATQ